MIQANIELLKKLRSETSASIADCRMALEETNNDYDKAKEWLRKRGLEKAEKKTDRVTSQGIVDCYIHHGGKVGVLLVLLCETDFVAKTDEFKHLAKELGMQIAAMNPKTVEELYKQEYIRDASMTVSELIKSVIGKLGENITLREFIRYEI
jgi:elongation factor Ts